MKFLMLLSVFAVAVSFTVSKSVTPEVGDAAHELTPFIGEEEKILANHHADINNDGLEDVILITEHYRNNAPDCLGNKRGLKVLLRNKKDVLTLSAQSENIVLGCDDGGMSSDAFSGIATNRNSFTILHAGGSGSKWTYDISFQYSEEDKNWYLSTVKNTVTDWSFESNKEERKTTETIKTVTDFGLVSLINYDKSILF